MKYIVKHEYGHGDLKEIMTDWAVQKYRTCQKEESVVYSRRNDTLCSVEEKREIND